jgi:peptidoglycan/LPS O-acetylase OafA/YrhL
VKTIGTYIDKRENNFNLIRFCASFSVLFSHCYPLSLGKGTSEPLFDSLHINLGNIAVYVFFIISGFLVSHSFTSRNNIFYYFEARLVRIYPGLIACVLFCVFIVGSIFTILSLSEYFSNQATFRYLAHNATLWNIRHALPGVFKNNPYPDAVNGSLWVLPLLIKMYILVGIMGALKLLDKVVIINTLFLIIIMSYLVYPGAFIQCRHAEIYFAFLLGTIFYINRNFIPVTLILVATLWFGSILLYDSNYFLLCLQLALAYTTIWFAYIPVGFLHHFNKYGDYSYGMYIYAFPIQQILAASIINIKLMQMAAYSSALTFILAFFSWHFIEKPMLYYKGNITNYFKTTVRKAWL